MPLIIPKELPAYQTLSEENIFVMNKERASSQMIRPLRILVMNLMPTKIITENQITRLLANGPLQVQLTLLKTETHDAAHVSETHMQEFYRTFSDIKNERFDGMIITGAPVETIAFEEVDYWDELCEIMEWSKSHVYSTLHVCWGAQAALYYHYGVHKRTLPNKMFGIFKHKVVRKDSPLVRGFDDEFYAPHSRHTEVVEEDVLNCPELRVIARSETAGVYLLNTDNGRQIFVMGHPEYDKYTLDSEYKRDLSKGLKIEIPVNYYKDDDPGNQPIFSWRSHAFLMYHNWMNYYVYQDTPYDLEELEAIE